MLFLTATVTIFSHNCDNYVLYAELYLVKNSFHAYFSRTILAAIDHMQEHIFTEHSLKFTDFLHVSR